MTTSGAQVLIEHENPRIRAAQAAALEAAGFDVVTCAGPRAQPGRVCPLVPNGHCAMARDADVIVNELPLGDVRVYVAQRTCLADQPVLLGVSERDRARHPTVERVATTIPRNATGPELVQAVRAAMDGHVDGP